MAKAQEIPNGPKYLALVCAMAVNFMIGSYYTYSSMYIYVHYYLKDFNPGLDDKGNDVKLVLPMWLFVQSCFSILSVKVAEKIGYKALNFIAFTVFCLNNVAMIFVTNYYTYIFVYGFMNGVAIGFGYCPALYTAWTYFPDKKSVATGVILFCAGMSASISSPIVTKIVNPHNLKNDDPRVKERVPFLFTCVSFAFGIMTLIFCTLQPNPYQSKNLKEKKELKRRITLSGNLKEKEQLESRIRSMSITAAFNDKISQRDREIVTKEIVVQDLGYVDGEGALIIKDMDADNLEEMITDNAMERVATSPDFSGGDKIASIMKTPLMSERHDAEHNNDYIMRLSKEIQDTSCPSFYYGFTSRTFLMLAMMAFCCAIYNYFLLNTWKEIFTEFLDPGEAVLSYLLSIGAVANSSFRIFAGLLLLKVTFKHIYYVLISCIVLGSGTFYLAVTSTKSLPVGIAYLFFGFAGLGTTVTIFPTICTKAFGSDIGPKLYPIIYLCFSIASLTSYGLNKFLSGSKEYVFYILFGLAITGLTLNVFFVQDPDWTQAIVKHAHDTHKEIQDAKAKAKIEIERKKSNPSIKEQDESLNSENPKDPRL